MFIKRSYETEKLCFKFIGVPKNKKEIDSQEQLELLLDDCFNDDYNISITRSIELIRTILSNYTEKYLEIAKTNNFGEIEHVKYMNRVLTLYEVKKELGEEPYNLKYEMYKGLNIEFPTKKIDNIKKLVEEKESILDIVNSFFKTTKKLQNTKAITLDEEGEILCHIYELFYNETPDFRDKDINTKFQSMMAILAKFGIRTKRKIEFTMNYKNIPTSLYLQLKLERYKALGKIKEINPSFKPCIYVDSLIEEISMMIRSSIPEEYDETEVLEKISSILYAKSNKIISKAKIEDIAKISHSAPPEVKNTLKLVKRINDRIYR